MRRAFLAAVATAAASLAFLIPARSQQSADADMAERMKKVAALTQPGEHHELLKRFLGEWDTETSFVMAGERLPPEKGTSTGSWLMDGRWVQMKALGQMMRRPVETYQILGYDNFKKSYVWTSVNSIDTAMVHAEGDADPKTGALLMYGTLDEYLTGENDKMIKYVWRFPDDDTMLLEVHDLPIGERNTQVVEIAFHRRK